METLIASSIPLGAGLLIWIIKKVIHHDKKIFSLDEGMKAFTDLKIGSTLDNHELRITIQEDHKRIINEKLDKLISSNANIEGILKSKKDKE